MVTEGKRFCDGCDSAALPNEKLLVCRGCHKAWYHNSDCQRRDWRARHKAICSGGAKRTGSSSNYLASRTNGRGSRTSSTYHCYVEARQDWNTKSWGIWCCNDMSKRQRIVNEATAMVNPVLLTSQRNLRCSYCFQKLLFNSSTTAVDSTPIPSSPIHWHCNRRCRTNDKFWEWEAGVILEQQKQKQHHQNVPTPTLLYILRILRSPYNIQSTIISHFVSNLEKLSSEDMQNCQAIAHLSLLLISRTPLPISSSSSTTAAIPTIAHITKLISIIMMNAFHITEGEGTPVGIGLYPMEASRFNHSCEPNAIQTFMFLPATSPPRLNITTTSPVKAGEELSIAYIDTSLPTAKRRWELWSGYKFLCSCVKCQDVNRDCKVIGIRCPRKSCKGYGCYQQQLLLDTDNNNITDFLLQQQQDIQQRWDCSECGETDLFHAAINERDKLLKELQQLLYLQNSVNDLARSIHEQVKAAAKKMIEFKHHFFQITHLCTNSSWYTLQVEEELSCCTFTLLTLLDAVNMEQEFNESEWHHHEWRSDIEYVTRVILPSVRAAGANCYASSLPDNDSLRFLYSQVVSSKVTQYLSPCTEALQTLSEAYGIYKFYYTPEQEIMKEIAQLLI